MSNSTIKILCLSVLFSLYGNSRLYSQWQWISPGYTNSGAYADVNSAVATDANGAVYTTGRYYQTNTSDYKISLKKYAPNGTPLHQVLHNNGTGNDVLEEGNDIAVSLVRNKVVIGGSQYGKPFLGFFYATTNNCSFISQVNFTGLGEISKIDLRGDEVWVIGNFTGNFSPGGTVSFVGNTQYHSNIFIAKYSMVNGALLSAAHIKCNYLKAYDIKVDPSNNIYFTARAIGSVQFVTGGYIHSASTFPSEAFAAKLSPSYQVLWIKQLPPSHGDPNPYDRYPIVFVPGATGCIVVGGLNSNKQSCFIQKRLDSNGALLAQTATIPLKAIRDLTAGCGTAIYVTGNTISNTANCTSSLFFDKYNFSNCAFVSGQNSNACALGEAVVTDGVGNPVVTGNFGNYTPTFTLGGINLSHPNQRGTFAGIYDDVNGCCQNRGLVFDGVDDYVRPTTLPMSGNPNFTFEAWVHSIGTGNSSNNCIGNFRRLLGWGNWGGNQIDIGECGGYLTVYYYNTFITTQIATTGYVRGGWQHVAVVRSGSILKVYVNGVIVGTNNNLPYINISPNASFFLGRATSSTVNGVENWKGRMDEVRLWNYAKSQGDIQAKKDCALLGNEPGLVLYYPFDHGQPNSLNTGANIAWNYKIGSTNHATLQNFALTGSLSNWICSSVVLNGSCPLLAAAPNNDRTNAAEDTTVAANITKADIRLFPNPNTGTFTVELPQPATQGTLLRITDPAGRLVFEQSAGVGVAQQAVEADTLPTGLYYLQVVLEGKVLAVERFVINR